MKGSETLELSGRKVCLSVETEFDNSESSTSTSAGKTSAEESWPTILYLSLCYMERRLRRWYTV